MRLIIDRLGKPYDIVEIVSVAMLLEIYVQENGARVDIDMRDIEYDAEDCHYKMDPNVYDYFPDEIEVVLEESSGLTRRFYYDVGRSKEVFYKVIDDFDVIVEKLAKEGYCRQSDFKDGEWE